MKLLGQRVRLCRKLLGMTQAELAGDDFTKSFISQIECGHAVPSIRALLILAERLGQKPGYFLDPKPSSVDLDGITEKVMKQSEAVIERIVEEYLAEGYEVQVKISR